MKQEKSERQLKVCIEKGKKELICAKDNKERAYIVSVYIGFLTGLYMANAITKKDHDTYQSELKKLVKELDNRETHRRCINANTK